jgi:hypothetical protein
LLLSKEKQNNEDDKIAKRYLDLGGDSISSSYKQLISRSHSKRRPKGEKKFSSPRQILPSERSHH